MKKTEAMLKAIEAVIRDEELSVEETADVLYFLYPEYRLAKYAEKQESEEAEK